MKHKLRVGEGDSGFSFSALGRAVWDETEPGVCERVHP